MSGYEVRWGAIEERLRRIRRAARTEESVRVAALVLELVRRHRVDGRGRCAVCGSGLLRRACRVFPTIAVHLEQPLATVLAVDDRAPRTMGPH